MIVYAAFKHHIQGRTCCLCRVWHSPGWPCSRWRSCTGGYSWSSRQAPWQESGRGGRRTWTGGKRTGGRRRSRNNQVHMHGWDEVKWHCEALEPMWQCEQVTWLIYTRRASCSVVRGYHVCVSHGVHIVGHSGLRIVDIVHEDIHNVP